MGMCFHRLCDAIPIIEWDGHHIDGSQLIFQDDSTKTSATTFDMAKMLFNM
jgi:acetoin utilization deacetylase AcuC-like enzyme